MLSSFFGSSLSEFFSKYCTEYKITLRSPKDLAQGSRHLLSAGIPSAQAAASVASTLYMYKYCLHFSALPCPETPHGASLGQSAVAELPGDSVGTCTGARGEGQGSSGQCDSATVPVRA